MNNPILKEGKNYHLIIPHWRNIPLGTKFKVIKSLQFGMAYAKFPGIKRRVLVFYDHAYGYKNNNPFKKLLGWLFLAIPASMLAQYFIKNNRNHDLVPILKEYYFETQFNLLFEKQFRLKHKDVINEMESETSTTALRAIRQHFLRENS